MMAGVVGVGLEHVDNKSYEIVEETVHAALENEVNFFDLFMPGKTVREQIGRALKSSILKGNREKVLIQGHIGSVDLKQQYDISRDVAVCRRYFDELLQCLETEYIDLGMMFFIDTDKDYDEAFKTEYLDYVLDLKKQGKIRAIGASAHNPATALKVVQSGVVEHLMFSINLAFDMMPADVYVLDTLMSGEKIKQNQFKGIDPIRANLYEYCAAHDISISVMKPLCAGKLLSAEQTPFAKPLSVGQCIHYALTRPAVASVLVGCQSKEQVLEAVRYFKLSDEDKDYSGVAETLRETFRGKCVYCNHCLPCPSEIDIASTTKYLEIAAIDPKNVPPSIRQHYENLSHQASECIQCGSCEERCPFGVPVIQNMERAVRIFGQ